MRPTPSRPSGRRRAGCSSTDAVAVGAGRREQAGQATVEAAVLVPVILLVLALMCQPAILAYDRMVMGAAAGQGARMLATRPAGSPDFGYKAAIEDQLAAIPDIAIFHADGPRWDIELAGDEESGEVRVKIAAAVEPLPLVRLGAAALGALDGQGRFRLEVECTEDTRQEWLGGSPSGWVSQWG